MLQAKAKKGITLIIIFLLIVLSHFLLKNRNLSTEASYLGLECMTKAGRMYFGQWQLVIYSFYLIRNEAFAFERRLAPSILRCWHLVISSFSFEMMPSI